MKNIFGLICFIFFTSLFSCNNSDNFPLEENYDLELAINIKNYTDLEFPSGTMIYLCAIIKDTFVAVDSINIKQKILSRESIENKSYSEISIPKNVKSSPGQNLPHINISKIKPLSNKGALLIRFPNHSYELVDHKFFIYETHYGTSFATELNLSENAAAFYYSFDIVIQRLNLQQRNKSILIFKQLTN